MKYGLVLKTQGVPEWQEMYINYRLLKKMLKPFQVLSKVYFRANYSENLQKSLSKFTITNATIGDIVFLKDLASRFEKLIFYEFEKITTFYEFKLIEQLKRWRLFKINATILANLTENLNYEVYKQQLKRCFQQFYKEIVLVSEYLRVNLEGFRKIIKKFKKLTKNILLFDGNPENSLKARFDYVFANSFIQKNQHKSQLLKSDLENQYIELFYKKFNRKAGHQDLRKISQGRLISQIESFYFGLFLGIAIFLIFLIFILTVFGGLDVDSDALFRDVFPMFRGIAAFILYIWLLAWNVYGWTKANINYKLIFGFNYHFSQVSEILKRASFFTMLFLFMFLWYVLLRKDFGQLTEFLAILPKELTPLIVWIFFLGYLFYPSQTQFNPQGRIYTYKILRDIFFRPFSKVSFKIAWSTDQLASFVGPLKDLEYTICYYSGDFVNDPTHVPFCQSRKRFSSGFVVAFIPLFLRIVQCLRNMYDKKTFFGADFFNCLKYVISLIVVVFSFVTSYNSSYFDFWIVFAIISTFYSSFWDLKMDWGFLNLGIKNHLLRKTLSYEHKALYYIAMSLNLLLRFGWTLSISPDIMEKAMRPEIFAFFISFLEMLRRSIWNFYRLEKEHISNCGIFKAVEDIVLPFENICFNLEMNDLELQKENNSIQNVKFLLELNREKSAEFIQIDERKINEEQRTATFNEENKNLTTPPKPTLKRKFTGSVKNDFFKSSDDLKEPLMGEEIFNERNNSEFRRGTLGKVSLFSKKSVMDITKDELRNRAFSLENYEDVKREVDEFCRAIKQNIEFKFKVLENKEK